jgi:Arc/MetJ family transcription regulator
MRTNIVLDDQLIERARQLTGIRTKRELIHEALRMLIQLREQGDVRQLRGRLHWQGDLEQMRLSHSIHDGE